MAGRKSPILLKKLARGGRSVTAETIGIIGVHQGAGVTYTGLMLAFYLGEEMGQRTAYLECNKHQDMSLIEQAYEWQREEEDYFTYGRISCYKNVAAKKIPEILSEGYEYVVMDFGTDYAASREEFLRCTRKLVLCSSSEWNLGKLLQFVRNHKEEKGNENWHYLLPFARPSLTVRVKTLIKRRVLAVPLMEEPTRPTRSLGIFLRNILG